MLYRSRPAREHRERDRIETPLNTSRQNSYEQILGRQRQHTTPANDKDKNKRHGIKRRLIKN